MIMKIKTRQEKENNYKSIFFDGKTIRTRINPLKPISEPNYPEIEDVAINSKCFANCPYCYTSATKHGKNFYNILNKANEVWTTKKPFQIAIGGAGEPTLHPNFNQFLKVVHDLDILPNYTTNGMHLNDDILNYTNHYCGGVAVSYHPHISKVFFKAIEILKELDIKLNAHIIIGEKDSLSILKDVYDRVGSELDYLVILPYQAVGRAKNIETYNIWSECFEWISKQNLHKFAYGALFYDYLNKNKIPFDIDVYEPEIYSGYRIMDDSYRIIRKSSYNLEPK